MFAFPSSTASDLVRNNIETQLSLFLNLSKSFTDASMQLGELNLQASRKLMEESATALTKGMQLRTLTDTQSFIAEQLQVTAERVRGYALNVQNIAAQNWAGLGKPGSTGTAQQPPPESAEDATTRKEAASSGQHEVDQTPSPLVEKLIASAINDVDKLH